MGAVYLQYCTYFIQDDAAAQRWGGGGVGGRNVSFMTEFHGLQICMLMFALLNLFSRVLR